MPTALFGVGLMVSYAVHLGDFFFHSHRGKIIWVFIHFIFKIKSNSIRFIFIVKICRLHNFRTGVVTGKKPTKAPLTF